MEKSYEILKKNWWRSKKFFRNFTNTLNLGKSRKSAGFQNKFQERLKAKNKHFRIIIKSRHTWNYPNQYFEKFLRKIINFYKKFEERLKIYKKKLS